MQTAIAKGAPTYNKGDHRGCYEIYKHVAQAYLQNRRLAASDGDLLKRALNEASMARSNSDKAWAMRRAFDMILGA